LHKTGIKEHIGCSNVIKARNGKDKCTIKLNVPNTVYKQGTLNINTQTLKGLK